MQKLNCWEYKHCERGLGAQETAVCPAAVERRLDRVHDGIYAGRACWIVSGTKCDDTMQGTFVQKYKECGKCDFYEYVKKQEGDDLLPSIILLKKLEE